VTQHEILLARAQALSDSEHVDHLTVALCDVALGRQIDAQTLDALDPSDRWRLTWMPSGEARDELNRRSK
jgi:hypothetical protein